MPRCLPAAALALALCVGAGCHETPNSLRRPANLCFDRAGNVVIEDFQNHRLVRFGPDGSYLGSLGERGVGPGKFMVVMGATALPDGGLAVVDHSLKDLSNQTTFRRVVHVFGPDLDERFTFAPLPDGWELGWPEGITALPDGTLVVTDTHHDSLFFFDPKGRHISTLHEIEGGPPLSSPSQAVFHDGHLWVAEYREHRIRKLTLDGRQVMLLGTEGTGPSDFLFPVMVAVSDEGWFVVADLGNYRLQRFDAAGKHLGSIVPAPAREGIKAQLEDVDIGPDGLIYTTDSKGNRVLVYRPDGTLVREISRWL